MKKGSRKTYRDRQIDDLRNCMDNFGGKNLFIKLINNIMDKIDKKKKLKDN